jgi:hypothetical protein
MAKLLPRAKPVLAFKVINLMEGYFRIIFKELSELALSNKIISYGLNVCDNRDFIHFSIKCSPFQLTITTATRGDGSLKEVLKKSP